MNKKKKFVYGNLALAAVGLAIVSFATTSQGLQDFVFDKGWQAILISSAVQITLFVLNLKLMHYIKKNKWVTLVLWIAALCGSICFSYVYISNSIYKDPIYYADANRILKEETVAIAFEVEDSITDSITYSKDIIDSYCSSLMNINFDENNGDAYEVLRNYADMLKQNNLYKEGEETFIQAVGLVDFILASPSDKISGSDLESMIDTVVIIEQNIESLKDTFEVRKDDALERWKSINDRLSQYSDFRDPEFIRLQNQNNATELEIEEYTDVLIHITSAKSVTELCLNNLQTEKNNDISSQMENAKQSLLLEMNKENPQKNIINNYMNEIYALLIQVNGEQSGRNIRNYYYFKQAVDLYNKYIALQERIKDIWITFEPEQLNIPYGLNKDETEKKIEIWRSEWLELINEIKSIAREYPILEKMEIKNREDEAALEYENVNMVELPAPLAREKIITKLSSIERKYLTDLNVIEKAANLLSFKYRKMAVFSLLVAIFLDVFSGLIGIFLYYSTGGAERTVKKAEVQENVREVNAEQPATT